MSLRYEQLAAQLEEVAARPPAALLDDDVVRRRLLVAVQKVLPELETFQDTCQRLFTTPLELSISQIGCNLKLFETLAAAKTPVTTAQLAKTLGSDSSMLDRILKYMASLAMIREVGEQTWAASRTTYTLAQPSAAAGIYHYFESCGPAVQAFPQWLEDHQYQPPRAISNTPWTSARNGQDIVQWMLQHPTNMVHAERYMTIHRFSEGAWINAFPFQEVVAAASVDPARPLFVDVAGGLGQQCKSLLATRPEWKGRIVLEELPQVVEKTPPIPGVELKGIDIFTEQPVKGAKVYYLRSVLHDWPDDRCLVLLSHIKSAMAPDSILIIDETVVPPQGAHKISMQIDLIMLLCLAGCERSERQWYELLGKAGFKINQIHRYHKQDDEGLIVATIA